MHHLQGKMWNIIYLNCGIKIERHERDQQSYVCNSASLGSNQIFISFIFTTAWVEYIMVMITHVFKVCDLIKKMKTNNYWYRSVVPLETDHNIVHAGFFFLFMLVTNLSQTSWCWSLCSVSPEVLEWCIEENNLKCNKF